MKKGNSMLILNGEERREANILEAYVYDPNVPANDLEVIVKANMGKQCFAQWQQGWLILDDEETVANHTTVIC